MVQVEDLIDEDYLTPLGSLHDILLNPEHQSQFTPSKLLSLLTHHLNKLRAPYKPFASPATSSRTALKGSSVNLPHTSVTVDIDEKTRKLAYRLSERADIDEVEALILIRTCGDEDNNLDRLILWYAEEALSVPRLVMALQRLSQKNLGEWSRIAGEVLANIISDEEKYIEMMFRAWSNLAQKPLEGTRRMDQALFWATLQLRLQNELLDLLFLILYDFPDRPASISLGVIKGVVASAFGTMQANREIWNTDEEAQRQQQRIRDLALTIALEAMCLSTIVTPRNKDDIERALEEPQNILLRSRDTIIAIDVLLNTESKDLVPRYPEPDPSTTSFPTWPMPLLCLAWSIVHRYLPIELQPPTAGYERPIFEEFAARALRLPSGLFPWLEEVLTGPLFARQDTEEETSISNELSIWRRKVVKDLLMGLSDLVQLRHIVDRSGLYRVWDLVFGGGSPSSSLAISEDYWVADYAFAGRSAVLDDSHFPHDPATLPLLLAALSGAQPEQASSQSASSTSPASAIFEYMLNLPALTIRTDPSVCSFNGEERSEQELVEAKKDMILPGVLKIRAGTKGEVVSRQESKVLIVRWDGPFAAWGLLVEVIRAAIGLRPMDQRDGFAPENANFAHLSMVDLGLEGKTDEILGACLELLRVVLQPILGLTSPLLGQIRSGDQPASVHVLETALATLDHVRHGSLSLSDYPIAKAATSIIQSLLYDPIPAVWNALHHSSFFGALGKRRSIAADIIELDSVRGDHSLTLAVLKLVAALAASTNSTVQPDDTVVRSALQLVVSSIWLPSSGWRFKSMAAKYQIISLLSTIFTMILQHPLDGKTSQPTLSAQFLIDTFVTSSSLLTYRPLLEVFSQAPALAVRLLSAYRTNDARSVVQTLDYSLSFLSTTLRIASNTGVSAEALPKGLFAAPVLSTSGDKVQAIEIIFDLASRSILPPSTRLSALTTLRTYLETTSSDSHRPSLAGLLRDAKVSFVSLAEVAENESLDLRAAIWNLFASVLSCQPGCANFCTGTLGDTIEGALEAAVGQIMDWQAYIMSAPRSISSVLAYCNAVLACPGASKAVAALRKREDFWTAMFEIATWIVPPPPTFTLSMHSEDFASRIQAYAFAVQAKAEAVSLLAAEFGFALESEEDVSETKVQSLISGLFRSSSGLTELAVSASHSSCTPRLHEEQAEVLRSAGVQLSSVKTLSLPSEREYGALFLYDGEVRVPGDDVRQASVNLALDMLNLNWSMLEADLSLTRSFHRLAETAYNMTEGDPLAAAACLRAGASVAEILASEDQGGDVMLAIQCERLIGLSNLLETALGEEDTPSRDVLMELVGNVRHILESQSFPPMIGLRFTNLPAIHKPLLHIVHSVFQALPALESSPLVLESTVETAMAFTLDAADVVLDSLMRESKADLSLSSDLEQITGIVCEITRTPLTHLWLDKLSEHNTISRSLEIVSRMRISDSAIQPHVASVLLMHLALAGTPSGAEKLAVSGLLPSYSDNAISLLAEQAKIIPPSPTPQANSAHGAWCTMLWVVHAVLSSLPDIDAGTFARNDVIPFLRVCTAQILHTLQWDGETPLSLPIQEEVSQVTNLIHALVNVIGPNDGLLSDLAVPMLQFLKSVRFSLSHPRILSTLMLPSSEEERVGLEKEWATFGEDQEPKLVDFIGAPILAQRTVRLLGAATSTVMSLLVLTQGWTTLKIDMEDPQEEFVLAYEDDPSTAAEDPVGVLNDILSQTSKIVDSLPLSSSDPSILTARSILTQLQESSTLLSASQLVLRYRDEPETHDQHDDVDMNPDMSYEQKDNVRRRISLANLGPVDRARNIHSELTRDLLGTLGGLEGNELMRWLGGVVERKLAIGQDT